jgi:hypothetical protein
MLNLLTGSQSMLVQLNSNLYIDAQRSNSNMEIPMPLQNQVYSFEFIDMCYL